MSSPAGRLGFSVSAYDAPVATELIETLQQVFVTRYGGRDRTPVRPEEFAPPLGLFVVGRLDGAPMSCGGGRLLPDDPTVAEVKRMFVAEAYRGHGHSRVLLAELEARARAAGVR